MKFEVEKRSHDKIKNYYARDIEIARNFAKHMYKEFGSFIRGLVLFGSTTLNTDTGNRDIDVLVVVDDVRYNFSRELIQTYRIITEKIMADIEPKRLHVQSMRFTSFWEYIRAGDPVAINIL